MVFSRSGPGAAALSHAEAQSHLTQRRKSAKIHQWRIVRGWQSLRRSVIELRAIPAALARRGTRGSHHDEMPEVSQRGIESRRTPPAGELPHGARSAPSTCEAITDLAYSRLAI